ncbi:hypothetical protein A2U01_0016206 [Trifolium medium]|uniref:Uncharacterized protein n=1 Tax=Trifolium medium TaxID=97028 RepID=A0A392N658_9FABA|nr:hypothetical protein [Trifolium medium]
MWFIFHSQLRKIDIYHIQNTHLTAVFYNNRKSNLFRIHVDVKLAYMKHQLDQLNGRLNCRDARRAVGVEYHRLSVCSDGRVLFTNMKLQNDSDCAWLKPRMMK